ncbi:response regulator [Rhizobium sp. Leaf384]|uniref:response regulator n=1 Tax=Rhizobium sp. Leaf384 TaxID=1736358 RepID=UPI00138F381C|nr:response regulator [Rhizobium sp. Leaf384]
MEDEPLIAIDIEDTLAQAGFGEITILRSCHDGLEYLKGVRPDAALLDLTLTDGVCHKVAERLRQMEVPFIVYSGLEADHKQYGEMFRGASWLLKPAQPEELVEAILSLIGSTDQ